MVAQRDPSVSLGLFAIEVQGSVFYRVTLRRHDGLLENIGSVYGCVALPTSQRVIGNKEIVDWARWYNARGNPFFCEIQVKLNNWDQVEKNNTQKNDTLRTSGAGSLSMRKYRTNANTNGERMEPTNRVYRNPAF